MTVANKNMAHNTNSISLPSVHLKKMPQHSIPH